jgi:type I restriction enzyme S subunit
LTTVAFLEHESLNDKGSTNLYLNFSDIAKYEFALPPIDEQQRIVELIGAIDRSSGSSESESSRFQELILALVHETVFQSSATTTSLRPLSKLLVMSSAGSWGVDAGSGDTDCMVIRSTEFTNIGALASVPPAIRGMSSKDFAKLELKAGDILVERSGGTDNRPVGRVISWPGELRAVPSNFVHLLRADESIVPSSVLKWTLWYLHKIGRTREFQTASTNMRNLRIKAYLEQSIPVLPLTQAIAVGRKIESAEAARRAEDNRMVNLRMLREQILSFALAGGDVH